MKLPDGYTCPECSAGVEWQEFSSMHSSRGFERRSILCMNCGEVQRYKKGERIVEP